MSRHTIELGRGRRLVVGWDPPLQTFYAQEHDGPEDGAPTMWIGTDLHALYDLGDLERALGARASALTPELAVALERDREENRG